METSLHRDLKLLYAGDDARSEVRLGEYRVDAIAAGQLVEIQHGSLAAIRGKVSRLLEHHQVVVVKPIVVEKLLVTQASRNGPVLRRRLSPKRGKLLDLFDDLVYFTQVFPHDGLVLDVAMVDVEEWRYPGHGRRRRWRARDYQVEDQKLVSIRETHRFHTAADLRRLIPGKLPRPFHTGHLAELLDIPRGVAQRAAYCLRMVGTVRQTGKQGNTLLYEWAVPSRKAAA
jgi:hypothetical protein